MNILIFELVEKYLGSINLSATDTSSTLGFLLLKKQISIIHTGVSLTLANGCNPTTSNAQAFQHASSNDIHSHDE